MKLSIITICKNSKKTIEATIKSVINQEFEDVEYIIVDGASTDGTLNVVNKYSDYITKMVSEPDNGISDAFNKGIRLATGDYIGIINSDDEYLPGAFNRLASEINNETDVFYGNGIRVYRDGKAKYYNSNPDEQSLHIDMTFCHPSTFVKKEAYMRYGLFSEDYKCVMDRELLLRMLRAGAVFQYSAGFYAVYKMGGMSDKYYYNKVIPESEKIDIADGTGTIHAKLRSIKRILMYRMVTLRDYMKMDKKKMDYQLLLTNIIHENELKY